MRKIILLFSLCLFSASCLAQGQSLPTLFAPNVINSDGDDYNPTFTPDGKTIFFTRRKNRKGNESIMFSILQAGKWSMPSDAQFSGKFFDKEPFVSPDGKRIFFASTRPNGRDSVANFDIWFVEKTGNGWSEPKNMGAVVNSADYDNYPSIAADGTLYFGSVRKGGRGENDLYRSRLVNGEYQTPENLGDIINTFATEADPFIAPDQSFLIFCSSREGGAGEGDLYVSFHRNGAWTVPQNLGNNINTSEFEYTPTFSPDSKTFYFSRGWGDIFQIDSSALNLSSLKQRARGKFDTPTVALENYVGEYELMPNLILIVTTENGRLFGSAKGRQTELKMIAADRFVIADAEVFVTFVKDAKSGQMVHAVVVENGKAIKAKKIK